MDKEIKIEPAESNCFAELQEDTFIKVENVCKPKLESNESALLENPLIGPKMIKVHFLVKMKSNLK